MKPLLLMFVGALGLVACSSTPAPPEWQMNAKGSVERAADAGLRGDSKIEAAEFARARAEVARTGRPDLMARVELLRCATRVAALDFAPCAGFDALAPDAAPAEQAYARYLAGTSPASDAALLPEAHRSLAAGAAVPDAALTAMADSQGRIEWCNLTAASHLGVDPQRDLGQYVRNLVRAPAFTAYLAAADFDHEIQIDGLGVLPSQPSKISLQIHPYGKKRKLMISRDVTAVLLAETMRRDSGQPDRHLCADGAVRFFDQHADLAGAGARHRPGGGRRDRGAGEHLPPH